MSGAPSASTILRDHVPFVVPFVPSVIVPGLRPGLVKRAPCRARFSARSRPEECHLREPAEFLGGRCINPALLRALEPCSRAVRSRTCRLRPAHRFSPLSRTEPSCSRRSRLPSLLRAGHHSLLPRAMYFRTSSLTGTARCRSELASQPARVSFSRLPSQEASDDPVHLHDIRWVPDGMLR
jgi:hypothetical protein